MPRRVLRNGNFDASRSPSFNDSTASTVLRCGHLCSVEPTTAGVFYLGLGDTENARTHLAMAEENSTTRNERELYAAKLALAGPWVHIPALLAGRHTGSVSAAASAKRLGLPAWQLRICTSLLCSEILRHVRSVGLDGKDRRRAYAAVARFYIGREPAVWQRGHRRRLRASDPEFGHSAHPAWNPALLTRFVEPHRRK